MSEIFDLVNKLDEVVGKTTLANVYQSKYYRVVNAFVINDRGELWIPRRSKNKKIYPLALDTSVGGHLKTGESYDDGFRRELKEELKLDYRKINYEAIGFLSPWIHEVSAFMKIYEIHLNNSPKYNTNEILEAQWISPKKLINHLEKGEYAKSDLIKLVKKFYTYEDRDSINNCRTINLDNLKSNKINNGEWIYEYSKYWSGFLKNYDFNKNNSPEKKDWASYYSWKSRRVGGYLNYHPGRVVENYPYFNILLKEIDIKTNALEIGIGAGTGVIELIKQKRNVTGLDIDWSIINLAKNNLRNFSVSSRANFILANLLNIPFKENSFSIVYSHGTLEHLKRFQIINAIKESIRIGRKLIFVVPNYLASIPKNRKDLSLIKTKFVGKNFGDENMFKNEEWEEILKKVKNAKILKKGGYWIPQLNSRNIHPISIEAYYGVGIYSIYIIGNQNT